MEKCRILLIAGVGLMIGAAPTLGDDFKLVQFSWPIMTGPGYQVTPVLEAMIPGDFELIDYRNDAIGLYYGVPGEVAALERNERSKLRKGVFQSTWARQIPGTREATENPLFNVKTGKFVFEDVSKYLNPEFHFEVISIRRADTSHFPILISEIRFPRGQSNIVRIAFRDDVNGTIAEITYHMPEKPTPENSKIWKRFVPGLREK